jgi:hypothetical protein
VSALSQIGAPQAAQADAAAGGRERAVSLEDVRPYWCAAAPAKGALTRRLAATAQKPPQHGSPARSAGRRKSRCRPARAAPPPGGAPRDVRHARAGARAAPRNAAGAADRAVSPSARPFQKQRVFVIAR